MRFYSTIYSLLGLLLPNSVVALKGLYYQIYTDAYAARQMQNQLSCVTAIFDDIRSNRGFYVFNGYNATTQKISKYNGQLMPSSHNQNCYDMIPSHGVSNTTTMVQQICVFPVDVHKNYLVASNGNLKRTFVLTKFQPDNKNFPSRHDPEFVLVNDTIRQYSLQDDLVPTNHTACFFYPPKDIDYVQSKPQDRYRE